jgi:hypothetical protein
MEKITLEQSLILLKERFPNFIPYWESYTTYWEIYEGSIAQMTPFAQYAIEMIKTKNTPEIKRIFEFIEFLLCEGDESVQAGAATIFLEYLLSKDPTEIKFSTFCQYLGKNSLGYCRDWDEYCGVRTDGLWTDEEKSALKIEKQVNRIDGYGIALCFLEKQHSKTRSRDIGALLSKMHFVNGIETADPNAWKIWNECVKTIKSKTKKGGFDIVEAYQTLQCFLEQHNQVTKSSDIASLLMGMVLLDYKSTRDPAAWCDWIECVNSCINWEMPVK